MDGLPSKYVVLGAAIVSTSLFFLTLDYYSPAGAQPYTMFLALSVLSWISTGLAFTHKKLWDK